MSDFGTLRTVLYGMLQSLSKKKKKLENQEEMRPLSEINALNKRTPVFIYQ